MTQNQIAYKNAIELERHNKATEVENKRHNAVVEAYDKWKNQLQAQQIVETARSNQANEEIRRQQNAINAAGVTETERHNKELERLNVLTTSSQTQLNKALEAQAAATSASNYASAMLSKEKVQTEKTVQALNSSNSLYTDTKTLNYGTELNYVLSQTDLNKARKIQTQAETGRIEVQTLHEGVSTLWDSIRSAGQILFNPSGQKMKFVNVKK